MLAECPSCRADVDAVVIASYECTDHKVQVLLKYTLAWCPQCEAPLLLFQTWWGTEWEKPTRLFPAHDDERATASGPRR